MKYYSEKSIGARLLQAEEAIIIGQTEEELKQVLATRGYGEAVLNDGATRVASVKEIDTIKREQLGLQVVATAEVDEANRTLRLSFETDRRMVRIAARSNPNYLDQLRLNENISKAVHDFVLQAAHFYKKVKEHPDVIALVQDRYNLGTDVLDSRLAEVAALEDALRRQQRLVGELRKVTQRRREAMGEVDEWMKGFIATARIAFREDRGSLDKLGIHVRRK